MSLIIAVVFVRAHKKALAILFWKPGLKGFSERGFELNRLLTTEALKL